MAHRGGRSLRFPVALTLGCLFWVAGVNALAQSVSVWLTTDDQVSKLQPKAAVAFSPKTTGGNRIFVDENESYQGIEGFGASFTDSAAYLLNEVASVAARSAAMNNLFTRNGGGIGISFVRNPMGGTDLSRSHYSYDDLPAGMTDPTLDSFSIAHDTADIIPLISQALQLNPQLTIMASPWSPPGWMKTSGSLIGGELLPSMYSPFANYFVKYIQEYEAAGIPVQYVSLQNEPLNTPGDYPGMSMPAATQLVLLRDYILPAFAANNITSKILVYDHNWDQPAYPDTVLADATVRNSAQVAGIAWHGYAGDPGVMLAADDHYPAKGQYETELSGGTWVSDPVRSDFEMITYAMRCGARSFIKWSLALDQNHGPNAGGCTTCNPLVTVNTSSGSISYNIDFFTLGHFSKVVLPGARRIYSANGSGLLSAAFQNPDGSKAAVVFNDTATSQTFQVQWGTNQFSYTLPAYAGASFAWAGTQNGASIVNASSRILASSFNDESGLQTEPCADTGGGFDLGYAANYDYVIYRNVDFGSGVSSVSARVASPGTGTLEVRLDATNGTRIANLNIPNTGGWQSWQTATAAVTAATGVHDVYLVFRGSGSIGNLNWFHFSPPAPWTTRDIGNVNVAGDASCDNDSFTVSGAGADIDGTSDAFRFAYQTIVTNAEMRCRVASLQNTDPWAKAGLMIRGSTSANAPCAALFVTPGNGLTFQCRTTAGGATTSTGISGLSAPVWLRLTRTGGNSFSAYYSSDGNAWTQIGSSAGISMTGTPLAGLAVTAHTTSKTCTANFESVSVNQPPTLSPIPDGQILAGRTLSITNSTIDPDFPAQTLNYTLIAAPAGASIDANSGVFSWRPTIADSPSTSAVQVVVSDTGIPSMSSTQWFNVTVDRPASPKLTAVPLPPGQFGLSVQGDVGPDYVILTSTNLLYWEPLLTTNPSALPFLWLDADPPADRRFYRVLLAP